MKNIKTGRNHATWKHLSLTVGPERIRADIMIAGQEASVSARFRNGLYYERRYCIAVMPTWRLKTLQKVVLEENPH